MSYLLLTGGRVVNSSSTVDADVLIRDGRIEAVGQLADPFQLQPFDPPRLFEADFVGDV